MQSNCENYCIRILDTVDAKAEQDLGQTIVNFTVLEIHLYVSPENCLELIHN